MTDDAGTQGRDEHPEDEAADAQGGSVSEVDNLGDGGPIHPDQSVAAAPGDLDEGVQEGRQGPNAVTGDETQEGNELGAAAQEIGRQDPDEAGHRE